MDEERLIEMFKSIGLSETKAKETLKNSHLTNNLQTVIKAASAKSNELNGIKGNLLYNIASKTKPQISSRIPMLSEYVALDKIDSEVRLNAAMGKSYIEKTSWLAQSLPISNFNKIFPPGLWSHLI